ncbi:CD4-2 molecule, tandem duplicate 2 [Polypterus senegalus]|uniref:CD4-2 molecule, tandem duplicate 2 n=1 Tax=Polypterus senegalus TaxID=55291 RepID=UPI001962CF7E|nr:CD4-2 molecule, tandem duplicate 2 [Polypterus senegalus]
MWNRKYLLTIFGLLTLSCDILGTATVVYESIGGKATFACKKTQNDDKWTYKSNDFATEDIVIRSSKRMLELRGHLPMVKRARIVQDFSLEIKDVESSDEGIYKCSSEGKEYKLCIVSVHADPQGPGVQFTPLKIKCAICENTPRIWQHPHKINIMNSNNYIINKEEGTIEIKSLSMEDAGTWTCKITNFHIEYKLQIIGFTGNSSLTTFCKKGDTAYLPCQLHSLPSVPDFGNLIITGGGWKKKAEQDSMDQLLFLQFMNRELSWNLSVVNKRLTFHSENIGRNLSVTIKNVQLKDAGEYICEVQFNTRILKKTVKILVEDVITEVTHSTGVNKSGHKKMSLWMFILIGVVAFVLIVLLIIVTILIIRHQRLRAQAKRRAYQRQALTPKQYCQCHRSRNRNGYSRQPVKEKLLDEEFY